jgi:soluble lytic murein transglycosylase-like protein
MKPLLITLSIGFVLFLSLSSKCYSAASSPSNGSTEPIAASSPPPAVTLPLSQPFPINHANRRKFSPDVARIAQQYRLDPALIHAVISAESGFNPTAVSPAGAIGLMQLMPATAEHYRITDPFDPVANIEGGVRHLRLLLDRFKTIRLALAAYNAGAATIERNTPPNYPETRRYVIRVLHFYMLYKQEGHAH